VTVPFPHIADIGWLLSEKPAEWFAPDRAVFSIGLKCCLLGYWFGRGFISRYVEVWLEPGHIDLDRFSLDIATEDMDNRAPGHFAVFNLIDCDFQF
jgi:hypothetical protein